MKLMGRFQRDKPFCRCCNGATTRGQQRMREKREMTADVQRLIDRGDQLVRRGRS